MEKKKLLICRILSYALLALIIIFKTPLLSRILIVLAVFMLMPSIQNDILTRLKIKPLVYILIAIIMAIVGLIIMFVY